MILVKLDAINSTSSYLKQMSKDLDTLNWTVVSAEFQTLGRGQMRTKWESDYGKNLMFSILIKFKDLNIRDQFYLNCAISLGIFKALERYKLPQLKVKWPNDIMSVSKKIGGVLIENSIRIDNIYQSVVGIGLNINQNQFSDSLPRAVSMKQILKKETNREELLTKIVESIKSQIEILNNKEYNSLYDNYQEVLFKRDKVIMFQDINQMKFIGKITGVTRKGKLVVENENCSLKEYDFKEIKFL